MVLRQNVFYSQVNFNCRKEMKNIRLSRRLIIAFLLLFFSMSRLSAIIQETDSISKSVQVSKLFECTTNKGFPGASVIVIQHWKILLNEGFGLANIERNTPNKPETVFRLGSITKQFTAMAVLQLYNKRLLDIDDYVDKYFPGTLNGNKITIKHLLTHTSGITESLDSPLAFTPGDQISYSNTGYNLLGKIIEKVSGLSYENYLQRNIFKPLGMENTGYEHPDKKIKNLATGYKINDIGSFIDSGESDVSGAYAAGALYSTTADMSRWARALNTEKLVKATILNQAFSQATLNNGNKINYGFGWMVGQWRGLKEVAHGGDITGFNSYIAFYPDEQFTVIVLSNIEMRPPGPVPDAGYLAHKIAEIYLTDKLIKSMEHIAIQLDPKILDSYLGTYKWINASKGWIDASGESFTIYKKDNQLLLQSKAGEIELSAEAENHFFMKDDSIIIFSKSDDNTIKMVFDAMGLGVVIVNAQKVK
jgi:CubicO group peptidase (beta-lactamase class C family)